MRELSLHLLDIAENSISAGATRIVISVREDLVLDELWLEVEDNGKGMTPDMVAKVLDPFVTSRTTRKVVKGAENAVLQLDKMVGDFVEKHMEG